MTLPYYKQQAISSCSLACLRMVLESVGRKITEYELSKIIGFDPDVGFSPEMIRQACETINIRCKIEFENTLEKLRALISNNIFPIVLLNPSVLHDLEPVEYYHYIVVKDITDENAIINDPDQNFGGEDKKIPVDKFLAAWKDFYNMLIIVEGEEK